MGFFEHKNDDRIYLKSNILESRDIVHGFTSKSGGVSRGKITGLNLGFRVDDDENSVRENYRLLSKDLNFPLERTVLSKQTHTNNIRIVTEQDCGKGLVRESDIQDTDGLVTNIANIPLVIFTADCVPILLYDPCHKVVAALHAGWRGSVAGIASECISLMKANFNSDPKDILAAIGPCIGPCCFEFGEEAPEYFSEDYCTLNQNGKYNIDLPLYNHDLLTRAGVKDSNIDVSRICTMCRHDLFYSYRKHKDSTGRQGAVIMLR